MSSESPSSSSLSSHFINLFHSTPTFVKISVGVFSTLYVLKEILTLPRGRSMMNWSGTVVGHRGARFSKEDETRRSQYPENTIESFIYAIENDADGIEFDIRLIKSGEFVVFHDGFINPLVRFTAPRHTNDEDGGNSVGYRSFQSNLNLADLMNHNGELDEEGHSNKNSRKNVSSGSINNNNDSNKRRRGSSSTPSHQSQHQQPRTPASAISRNNTQKSVTFVEEAEKMISETSSTILSYLPQSPIKMKNPFAAAFSGGATAGSPTSESTTTPRNNNNNNNMDDELDPESRLTMQKLRELHRISVELTQPTPKIANDETIAVFPNSPPNELRLGSSTQQQQNGEDCFCESQNNTNNNCIDDDTTTDSKSTRTSNNNNNINNNTFLTASSNNTSFNPNISPSPLVPGKSPTLLAQEMISLNQQKAIISFDELSLHEIKQLRYIGSDRSITMPTFEEVIHLCQARKIQHVFVEIKTYSINPFRLYDLAITYVEFYRKHKDFMDSNTVTIAFNPLVLYWIRLIEPDVAVCLLHEAEMFWENGTMRLDSEAHTNLKFIPEAVLNLMDSVLWYFNREIFLDMVGSSMYGPSWDFIEEKFMNRLYDKGVCVYLWGLKDPKDIDEKLKRAGVCISCDGDYGAFKENFSVH